METSWNIEPKRVGRPAILAPTVADSIRHSIVTGVWRSGERLPTRRELCVHHGCSTITLQAAMNTLTEEGFIRSDGRHGTFVSELPPHLSRIAVVFPEVPVVNNHFWVAMDETIRQTHFEHYVLTCWYEVKPQNDNAAYVELCRRIQQHCLAGILFITPPFYMSDTPLVRADPAIPRVVFAGADFRTSDMMISTISFQYASFAERAFTYVKSYGYQRVAVVGQPTDSFTWWQQKAANYGIELKPYWFQQISIETAQSARALAHLMFYGDRAKTPDAVIVVNDNLLESFTQGLCDANVRVPKDVCIITHCNFPWPTHSEVPVIRLGWDTRGILKQSIEMINAMRVTHQCDDRVVDAVFENELERNFKIVPTKAN